MSKCDFTNCECLGTSCKQFTEDGCLWNEEVAARIVEQAVKNMPRLVRRLDRLLGDAPGEVAV